MTTQEKINKIKQLEKELEDWSGFARIMKSKIGNVGSSYNHFWSVSYYIKKLFGQDDYKGRHDQGATLNEEKGLLQLNYDYAAKRVKEIEQQIQTL